MPRNVDEDTDIVLCPAGNGAYTLDPYPFAGDRLVAVNRGRWFAPLPPGEMPDDLAALLYAQPAAEQRYTLVPR